MTDPKDCYSFDVAALPKEGQPDHVGVAVLVYGKLAREMRMSKRCATDLRDKLNLALAQLQET